MSCTCLVFSLLFSVVATAQTPLPTEFEVATIRQHKEVSESSRINLRPGGRIEASNITLMRMITGAYDVTEGQVVDAPAWVTQDRWDLEARADGFPADATPEQILPLVRKLLEDRFQLKLRLENRKMPVYRLTVAPGGHRLQPSVDTGLDSADTRTGFDKVTIEARRMGMQRFAQLLSRRVGRIVVDHTELAGAYDFKLEWSLDLSVQTNVDAAGPSVFTAIREQLGLRLEAANDQAPVLVIDQVEHPTEN